MNIKALAWLGVKTKQFEKMNALYRDVMGLELYHQDDGSSRFRLSNGAKVHVYGPRTKTMISGPVVGFLVGNFAGVASTAWSLT